MARTPLVLVHGNPSTAIIWGPLLHALDRTDAIALSPPGFGVPTAAGFAPSIPAYREWLTAQLELFREPVDLVGHDWGGIHVAILAMNRPDLIRSWASDALGVFAPDYAWHARAQVWQREGDGEESARKIFGGDFAARLGIATGLGMTGRMAERVAAGLDPEMGNAVLALLRSAKQPVMSEAGKLLSRASQRPGLALIAVEDVDRASGTIKQHEWAAQQAGATIARLEGVGHWWPEESPAPIADALTSFWAGLP
ncbi:alpha/beta hydrolase [Sphingomonas sp. BK235]|uniref:alpha/beta fold hydrolase n=1 Tax=Sphingomonas sp. BK235 TaxID=2512131 RepID=UPI00105049F6|nr:alpha/beta hydrolase [Sphingomonas sp. BK235]TCP30121.1 pimeloyl-ACP methyl ester carboxylesterase [Sphingomonas sp. BK235]